MKILHLTHTDVRVDSRILKELGALEAAGVYELHAIGMAEHGTEGGVDVLHAARVRSMRVFFRSFRWLPGPVRHVLIYLEMLLRVLVAGLSVRPRLVHCHDTPLLPVAVLLAWMCRAKLIYDAHELESDKNGQTALVSRGTYFLEKASWGGVDGFVTVSGSIMHWYESRFAKREAELVLNSPVIAAPAAQLAGEVERRFHHKYGISDERLVFVYLGLFVPGRGVEKLLQVFSAQDVQAHIVFVGRGPLRELIERCARDNPRVHVHDAVPHDQVVPLVKSADYGVCLVEKVSLSDYYSLPNKLFEYAFAGVPVLASDFPDMQKLVERFDLGACTADDEASIKQAVLRLQVSGRQRVTTDLTPLGWAAQASHLRGLYRRVLHPALAVPAS
ncbi:MAG: glycosyltransferase [Burkholderiales bacterium]|nr:glycosyltransferase [Burkholderiales bacterium]